MSVNNTDGRIGTNSRGYLKTTKFNTGSIRLLFIIAVYFYFLICANAQLVDRIKYYDVTGETTAEFGKNWNATQLKLGFQGYCWWKPVMSHSHIETRWGYRPSNLNLKVYVTLTLPRVKYPYDMPHETRVYYSQRIKAIYDHEYRHRAFKVQFYNEFMRDYNRLPAMRSSQGLYNETNRLLWKHYNNTKAKDAHFDRNGHK